MMQRIGSTPVARKRADVIEWSQEYRTMAMKERITEKLNAALAPVSLEVIDESHNHLGHSGWREGGETHFRVRIAAERFRGLTRIAQHRLVTDALPAELSERVHALALETRIPG